MKSRTLMVTGAAGSLGSALSRAAAARGFSLVLLDKDGKGLERVYDRIVEDGFSEPTDMVVDRERLYVTDLGSKSVSEFDFDGKFIRRFGMKPFDYEGVWGIPWGLDVSQSGRRFGVTYLKSNMVRIFDDKGKFELEVPVVHPEEPLLVLMHLVAEIDLVP